MGHRRLLDDVYGAGAFAELAAAINTARAAARVGQDERSDGSVSVQAEWRPGTRARSDQLVLYCYPDRVDWSLLSTTCAWHREEREPDARTYRALCAQLLPYFTARGVGTWTVQPQDRSAAAILTTQHGQGTGFARDLHSDLLVWRLPR
jgi:hypothetical protein